MRRTLKSPLCSFVKISSLLLMIFGSTSIFAAGYNITDIHPDFTSVPYYPYKHSYAYDLNDADEAVGQVCNSFISSDPYAGSAFLYSAETWTDLTSHSLTTATGINCFTEISADGPDGAYIYDHSTATTTNIGHLGGGYSATHDINDAGNIAGESLLSNGNLHAFFYDGTDIKDITSPAYSSAATKANAINNGNKVVGTIYDTNTTAFIWDNTTELMTLLTNPTGYNYTEAIDINNHGVIVGFAKENSYTDLSHAFITLPGYGSAEVLASLPGESWSEAYCISDNDQIVGTSGNKAVLWQKIGGVYTVIDLNDFIPENSAWIRLVSAQAINTNGSIVGWGKILVGNEVRHHAFLITPEYDIIAIPEPTSILLLLGAISGYIIKRSRSN